MVKMIWWLGLVDTIEFSILLTYRNSGQPSAMIKYAISYFKFPSLHCSLHFTFTFSHYVFFISWSFVFFSPVPFGILYTKPKQRIERYYLNDQPISLEEICAQKWRHENFTLISANLEPLWMKCWQCKKYTVGKLPYLDIFSPAE